MAATCPAAQAGAILRHFRRHLIQRYRIIDLTPGHLRRCHAYKARSRRLRAYDAVQLAAALGHPPAATRTPV